MEDHLHLALERLEKLENSQNIMETYVSQLKWSSYLTSEVTSDSKVAPVIFRMTESTSEKTKRIIGGVHTFILQLMDTRCMHLLVLVSLIFKCTLDLLEVITMGILIGHSEEILM